MMVPVSWLYIIGQKIKVVITVLVSWLYFGAENKGSNDSTCLLAVYCASSSRSMASASTPSLLAVNKTKERERVKVSVRF